LVLTLISIQRLSSYIWKSHSYAIMNLADEIHVKTLLLIDSSHSYLMIIIALIDLNRPTQPALIDVPVSILSKYVLRFNTDIVNTRPHNQDLIYAARFR
jgi:hypothetical protein